MMVCERAGDTRGVYAAYRTMRELGIQARNHAHTRKHAHAHSCTPSLGSGTPGGMPHAHRPCPALLLAGSDPSAANARGAALLPTRPLPT